MEPYCRAGSFSESSFLHWHNTLATHPCCWVYQNSTPFHCGIAFHHMELTDETLREYTFSSKEKPWTLQVLFLSFFFISGWTSFPCNRTKNGSCASSSLHPWPSANRYYSETTSHVNEWIKERITESIIICWNDTSRFCTAIREPQLFRTKSRAQNEHWSSLWKMGEMWACLNTEKKESIKKTRRCRGQRQEMSQRTGTGSGRREGRTRLPAGPRTRRGPRTGAAPTARLAALGKTGTRKPGAWLPAAAVR